MALDEATVKELNAAVEAATTKPDDGAGKPVGDNVSSDTASTSPPPDIKTPEVKSEEKPIETPPEVDEPKASDVAGATIGVPDPVTPSVATGDTGQAGVRIQISEQTVARAVAAGLSPRDARTFRSEALLLNILDSIEARKPAVPAPTVPVETDLMADFPTLDPEQFEPEVIQTLASMKDIIRKQQSDIQALLANQEQGMRVSQQANAQDTEKWFDEQVGKLGEDFHESLGAGGYRSLQQGSSQLSKRDALANQVATLIAGYRATGQQQPSRDEIFSTAARLVLSSEYEKAHEKRLTADLSQRSTQHIARASDKGSKAHGDPIADVAAMLDAKYFGKG